MVRLGSTYRISEFVAQESEKLRLALVCRIADCLRLFECLQCFRSLLRRFFQFLASMHLAMPVVKEGNGREQHEVDEDDTCGTQADDQRSTRVRCVHPCVRRDAAQLVGTVAQLEGLEHSVL